MVTGLGVSCSTARAAQNDGHFLDNREAVMGLDFFGGFRLAERFFPGRAGTHRDHW